MANDSIAKDSSPVHISYSTTIANVTRPSSLCLRRNEPPWRRRIWRETARPMPEPSVLVVKNGVKIFSATSVGIAFPLLVTSIWMRSSASMVEHIIHIANSNHSQTSLALSNSEQPIESTISPSSLTYRTTLCSPFFKLIYHKWYHHPQHSKSYPIGLSNIQLNHLTSTFWHFPNNSLNSSI